MPKIVDHDAYREELVAQAVKYFSDHGYAGASMRKIADHLGVSKSAIYHYFPSKADLFLACTKHMMSFVDQEFTKPKGSQKERVQQMIDTLRADFRSEMAISVEYSRGKTKEEIANDEAMQFMIEGYKRNVATIVPPNKVDETLALIWGTLLIEYFSGEL